MQKSSTRPCWDHVWMEFAHIIARRSYDPRYQVGSVVVSEDNTQVLAVGYNGNYRGGPNEAESLQPGESGMIHAEINSLLKMDYNNPKGKTLYVTLSPCRMCAKSIVNAGIQKVVYDEEYRDTSGLQLLRASGIDVSRFSAQRNT
jgi:dCMP deaminase